MRTDINKTFEILGGYLMSNDHLNTEYLADQVYIYGSNTYNQYLLITHSRMKSRNIALCWLKGLINQELNFAGYPGFYCNNYQLKQFDYQHSNGLNRVLDIVEKWITDYRQELKQFEKEQKGSGKQ